MKTLTKRQQEILDYLHNKIIDGKPTPSIREVASHFGLRSTKTIRDHFTALERKGMIKREAGKARAIQIIDENKQNGSNCIIPFLGSIPAGTPEDHALQFKQKVQVNLNSFGIKPEGKLFALQVHGDSMIKRGIYDRDIVILDTSKKPKTGDVVAALIDNEVTLKTFIKTNKSAFLHPENTSYSDIIPQNELIVQGVARIVIRTLQ